MIPSLVLNPRGTSGSGKTHTVNSIISHFGVSKRLLKTGTKKTAGYVLKGDIYVMGSYEIACGGADTVKTQDEVCAKVRQRAKKHKFVVFEGVLVSDVFGRYLELSKSVYPDALYIWGILDTPLDLCIKRVIQRRESKGNHKPFDPKKHTTPRFEKVQRGMANAIKEGQLVVLLDHRCAGEQAVNIIENRKFPKGRTYNLDKFEKAGIRYG